MHTSQFACVAMVTRLCRLRGVRGQLSVEEEIKPINGMNIYYLLMNYLMYVAGWLLRLAARRYTMRE